MLWTLFVCLYFSPYLSSGLHSFWVSHKRQAAENQPRTLFPENQRQPLFRHFANYHRDSVHKLQLFLSLNQLFTYQKDFSSSEIKRGGKDKEEKLKIRNWVKLLKKCWLYSSNVVWKTLMFQMIPESGCSFVLSQFIFNCAFSNHQDTVQLKLV